jgi:hypothetical protein
LSLAQKYYRLLNLPSTASVNAIKKAYRSKAKQLHPDRNPSPNAEEDFIELNEAYEYLIALKTKGHNNKQYQQVNDFEKQWYAEQVRRKEKARQQAQMRYEEYINSDDYKMNAAVDNVSNIILFLFIAFLPVFFFFMAYNGSSFSIGILVGSIALALVSPILFPLSKHIFNYEFSLKKSIEILKLFFISKWFFVLAITVFNIYAILTFTKVTFLTNTTLVLLFIIAPIILYISISIFSKKQQFYTHKKTICFALLPLLFNSIFIINYLGASQAKEETYRYKINFNKQTVVLQGNVYSKYNSIRFFYNNKDVRANNHITYTIKKGALGIRVVSDYKLFLDFSYI